MEMLFFSAFGLSLALWAVPGAVTTGALLSLLSPYTIAFWLGVSGMTLPANGSSVHALGMGVFFTGFLLAAVARGLFLSGVALVGRRFVGPGLFRWMSLGCGLMLGYFGFSVLACSPSSWCSWVDG